MTTAHGTMRSSSLKLRFHFSDPPVLDGNGGQIVASALRRTGSRNDRVWSCDLLRRSKTAKGWTGCEGSVREIRRLPSLRVFGSGLFQRGLRPRLENRAQYMFPFNSQFVSI
jgi:hypothetical protein